MLKGKESKFTLNAIAFVDKDDAERTVLLLFAESEFNSANRLAPKSGKKFKHPEILAGVQDTFMFEEEDTWGQVFKVFLKDKPKEITRNGKPRFANPEIVGFEVPE